MKCYKERSDYSEMKEMLRRKKRLFGDERNVAKKNYGKKGNYVKKKEIFFGGKNGANKKETFQAEEEEE